jgi:REP-associated tyrosine transposase
MRHHDIILGVKHRKIEDDGKDRAQFKTRLESIATDTKTVIYTWALMSIHDHLLLRSGPEGIGEMRVSSIIQEV